MLCNRFAVDHLVGPRCFQKYHFNFRFGAFDRRFYTFNGFFNFMSNQTVAKLDVRVNQDLFRGQMHSQKFNNEINVWMIFNCLLDCGQDFRTCRLAQ